MVKRSSLQSPSLPSLSSSSSSSSILSTMFFFFCQLATVMCLLGTLTRAEEQQQQEADLLLFFGSVVDTQGKPLDGARVQFWHTDSDGRYNHPSDIPAGTQLQYLDVFSYMGTSVCDENGEFSFRTYRPGKYAGRPITHIHFKVWDSPATMIGANGTTSVTASASETTTTIDDLLLTSQFYFSDDEIAQQQALDELLVLDLTKVVEDELEIDGTGNSDSNSTTVASNTTTASNVTSISSPSPQVFMTTKQIVVVRPGTATTSTSADDTVSVTGTNSTTETTTVTTLRATPRQAEGPFYPVVDFFDFGNDMTIPYTVAAETTSSMPSSSAASSTSFPPTMAMVLSPSPSSSSMMRQSSSSPQSTILPNIRVFGLMNIISALVVGISTTM